LLDFRRFSLFSSISSTLTQSREMRSCAVVALLLVPLATAQTWLEWSEWNGNCKGNGEVSAALMQTRFRVCQPPQEGPAAPCFGETTEVQPCTKCPATGTWGEWSVMDGCSDNCGAHGRRFRTRECKKPVGCPNVPCSGEAREIEHNGEPCDWHMPCLLPKRSCHPDYVMVVESDEQRTKCVKKTKE
ncbi:hypothetical protein PFISCL1PPCAC_26922, partial [Pristionchus fissidentatus]